MAGIGFELRKLFQGRGLLPGLRACLYSTFVTVGPALLCILMLTVLQQFLYELGVAVTQRELFMAAVIYSFVFSLILASSLTMVLARYISDKIYKNELEDILPSLHGAITICMVLGGLAGFGFYYHSPLDLPFKVVGYLLFMELIILWLQMVYVSALRDYLKLVKGFFAGVVSGLALAYVLVAMLQVEPAIGMLAAMNTGFFVIIIFFAASIQSYFKTSSRKYFGFLEYLDKYPALFLISFLYSLGLYVHNFVFWMGSYQINVSGTYVIAPLYDVPAFWAFLTVMPAIVIFVVSCETSFFEKYRAYYDTVCNGGTMNDINRSKGEMRDALSHSLRQVMGMQMVFTFISLLLGVYFLPLAGLTRLSINIFNVLVIGNYAFIILFILISILLYFDDRKGALMVVLVFVLANTLFTIASAFLGESYYGLGFVVAAFLSLALGFIRLNIFLKNIDYFTFCAQPMQQRAGEKVFTRLSRKIHTLLDDSR